MVVHRDRRHRAAAQGIAEEQPRTGLGSVYIALADLHWLADQVAAGIQGEAPHAFVFAAGNRRHYPCDIGRLADCGAWPLGFEQAPVQFEGRTQAFGGC